jgi:hypothetical protein
MASAPARGLLRPRHPSEAVFVGKVVKLSEFRKRKAKAEREKQAETNRRLHGRTKAERAREELQKQRLTRGLDGARLSKPTEAASSDTEEGENGEESEPD